MVKFETDLKTYKVSTEIIRFVKIINVFQQSIIRYINKLQLAVGLPSALMVCVRQLNINFSYVYVCNKSLVTSMYIPKLIPTFAVTNTIVVSHFRNIKKFLIMHIVPIYS